MSATTTTVRERPIIFSAEMVRAILDGRKTQTRRVMKPQPPEDVGTILVGTYHPTRVAADGEEYPGDPTFGAYSDDGEWGKPCPYGAIGDRLWVRETMEASGDDVWYVADETEVDVLNRPCRVWDYREGVISPIHMPRWASRITLEITDVRVQRLHEISDADVRAEGVDPIHIEKNRPFFHKNDIHGLAFGELWNKVNGKSHPWSSNPFVWVLSFRLAAPVRPSPARACVARADARGARRAAGEGGRDVKPYYEADNIVIYHGDNREILPQLTSASVDIVFTSPPYNLGNTTGGGFPNKFGHYRSDARGFANRGGIGKWANAALANGYEDFDDDLPHEEYVARQHQLLNECWRIIGERGAIFYNHKPRVLDGVLLTPLAYNPGLPVRQIIIWARAGGINFSPAFYVPTHEWIVVLAKPDFRLKSKGASGVGDVWQVAQESNPLHPAPFPITLPSRAIETTAPSVVLDPHCGIGTTLVAAKLAGVKAIGIELSERYCEIAAKKLAQGMLFGEAGAA